VIHLDTCVLVDALTGPRRSAPALRALIEDGERMSVSALVLYEWLCGPRHADEIRVQETLFVASGVLWLAATLAWCSAQMHYFNGTGCRTMIRWLFRNASSTLTTANPDSRAYS